MRVRKKQGGLIVQATAGSHVVLLGMNLRRRDCTGLQGFSIHRTDHSADEAYWMEGMKTFEATDPGFAAGSRYPTSQHPIQGFTWSDFSAKPGHRYTYRIEARRGPPDALETYKQVEVAVTTEDEAGGNHDIFFNRGAAASQEYARRFGNKRPDGEDATGKRWAWLSRGAMEAIEAFVARAKDESWGLRVSAYEFRLPAFAAALARARARRVDVKIVFDGNPNAPDEQTGEVFPRDANRATALDARIKGLCKERVTRDDVANPPISHHKFIVLLKGDTAEAVLTGSTNFSVGGVFGQSNVVHVVEDAAVAERYLACWKLLAVNTPHAALREQLSALNKLPAGRPRIGASVILSPQANLDALAWYAGLAKAAEGALFMTFAFGINKVFLDVYRDGATGLRYALLDKLLGPGVRKDKKPAAEKAMRDLRAMVANRFAVGNRITTNKLDGWVKEALTGTNAHVQYIHTKFMLIDPLGDDPIVVTGSANFSDASTTANDENMLVIRGNKRVADIVTAQPG